MATSEHNKIWEHIQGIPKSQHKLVECKRSLGAMAVGLKPQYLIECALHSLDGSPPTEPIVLHFSIEDVRVLKKSIDKTLAALDASN